MDIKKLLGQIESLREFLDEPAPATPTSDHRLKRYLAERYGPVWLSAAVASYVLPAQTIHIAIIAFRRGVSVRVVSEAENGELMEGQGIDPYPDESSEATQERDGTPVSAERECLSEIIPALVQASKIVKNANIKKSMKKQVRDQIAHAVKHLMSIKGA